MYAPTGSSDAVKRVTGKDLPGVGENGLIHLINSGAASLDGTGLQQKDGAARNEALLGDHRG